MAFASSRTQIPTPASRVDLSSVPRPRSYTRSVVCASSGASEQPGFPRRAAVLLSVPFLWVASPAHSAFIDIDDSRGTGAKEAMDSADQARDDQADERLRFSFQSPSKLTSADHQKRAKESYSRLSSDIKPLLDKKLYNRISAEARHQMGTLRYDLQEIGKQGDKSARKAAKASSKEALQALEELDLYARLGKESEASQAYSDALSKLGNIVKSYG